MIVAFHANLESSADWPADLSGFMMRRDMMRNRNSKIPFFL